ncbi:chromosome partitioning protein ParA [Streptomyces sp. SPB78]|uniref:ParA family protein n=1 Tax=Streptomyces sp. (strain SPB78) TaxID=591157 RepID=UPI0001B54A25|nr:ParA family protein [Streptomyces sp. SPB78]EFL04310.1 chromosome partitioning protein ParA [Streptomyces sp. SPB78]
MATRAAVGNNKGGAKKSTLVARLAEALAKAKKRVGVVDMDPQGNVSRRLGWTDDPENPPLTTSEAIEANAEGVAAQVWQPIGWDTPWASNITLMPARYTLEDRATEAGQRGAYRRLAKALKGADDHLDYVLLDCPPSLGHLTQMALAAAHHAIGSTEPEYDSVEALVRYRDFVNASGEDLANPGLSFAGVVVSGYDQRIGGHVGQVSGVHSLFGQAVWGVVPRRSLIANADEWAQPLDAQPNSHEARAVFEIIAQRLMKEIPA